MLRVIDAEIRMQLVKQSIVGDTRANIVPDNSVGEGASK